jgi:hypothetical protein
MNMSRTKEIFTAAGTLGCALGIGFVMQSSDAATERYGAASDVARHESDLQSLDAASSILEVQDIELTSAAFELQGEHLDVNLPSPDTEVTLAAASEIEPPAIGPAPQVFSDTCDITADARPMAAAMVNLTLDAACLPNERITIHHNGMIFTQTTSSSGGLNINVPALSETAVFVFAFGNGDGAVAQAKVEDIDDFDRTVLQWKDDAGFEIHALEFGASYGEAGHVWSGKPRDMASAITGEGGFITVNGDLSAATSMIAEVYTFPASSLGRNGGVTLSVEAEVNPANCGQEIEAQSLELVSGKGIRTREITLSVPDCDAVGSFLVLNNLFADLRVASN